MNKNVLLVIAFLFAYTNTIFAQVGPYNAEITYTSTSQTEYEIFLTLVQQCNGNASNTTETIQVRSGAFLDTITLTRISTEDISPLCDTVKSACIGGSGSSSIGINKSIYKGSIDFGSAPYASWITQSSCLFIFSYSGGLRTYTSNVMNTDNFYVQSTLNYCNLQKTPKKWNNSIRFRNDPIYYTAINHPFKSGYLASDIDKDSLSFALVAPKSSYNTNVTYTDNFSFNYPITCKCISPGRIDCKPVPNASPPIGTYLDPKTGELIYTAVSQEEEPTIAIETKEWRKDSSGKYLLIGTVTRDYVKFNEISGINWPPSVESASENYFVWEGDSIDVHLTGYDIPHVSDPNGKKDTTNLSWDAGIQGASFTITNPNDRLKKGVVSWRSSTGDHLNNPHQFVVEVKDDACPKIAQSRKGFSIYALDPNKVSFSTSYSCNYIIMKVQGANNLPLSITWEIQKEGDTQKTYSIFNDAYKEIDAVGKYYITAFTASNDILYKDSVNVSIVDIKPNLGIDQTIELMDTLVLKAGTNFTSYLWSDASTDSNLTIRGWELPSTLNTIDVTVQTNNGCTFKDQIRVSVNCGISSIIDMGKVNITVQDSFTFRGSDKGSSYLWNNGLTSKENPIIGKVLGIGTYNITLKESYDNGCFNTYNYELNVVCDEDSLYKVNELGPSITMFYNEDTTLRTQKNYLSYLWQDGSTADSFVIRGMDYPIGTKYFGFKAKSELGCTYVDSIEVTNQCLTNTLSVLDAKNIDLWDSLTVSANANFTSYLWNNGTTNKSNKVHGYLLGVGQHKLSLTTTDEKGCQYHAYALIMVTNETSIIENEKALLTIYPSPATQTIHFEIPNKVSRGIIKITDLQGKAVYHEKFSNQTDLMTIEIDHLNSGTYILTIALEDGKILDSKKFIKN